MTIAVDFDGTIVTHKYPEIGEEELPALVWCYEESFLTGSVGELEQILDRADRKLYMGKVGGRDRVVI